MIAAHDSAIARFLDAHPDATETSNGWEACCRAHDDRTKSLSISVGEDGRVLANCFAGCDIDSICSSVGMKQSDLFEKNIRGKSKSSSRTKLPAKAAAKTSVTKSEPSDKRRFGNWAHALRNYPALGKVFTVFKYHDLQGNVDSVVGRHDLPDGKKTIRPAYCAERKGTIEKWHHGSRSEGRLLYHLPEIIANDVVFVFEGEKAADAASRIGFTATTAQHGALSPHKTDWSPLSGKIVVIMPDNDTAGEKYALAVLRELKKLAVQPKSVRIVRFKDFIDDFPAGGDSVEFIEARPGATNEELFKEIERQAQAVPKIDLATVEAVADVPTVEHDEQATDDGSQAKPKLDPFGNVRFVQDDAGNEKQQALSVNEVVADLLERTGGWPRAFGSSLFVFEDGKVIRLKTVAALFAWIQGKFGVIYWNSRGSGNFNKEEFYAALLMAAEQYESIEMIPHIPQRSGTFYACQFLKGTGEFLARLLDYFNPLTTVDRQLLLAFFVTLFWGGDGGQRPLVVITSRDGRGVGKSKVVTIGCGRLLGEFLEIGQTERISDVKTRLLSPEGYRSRLVLDDNVKSYDYSSGEFEGLITCPFISGHEMYSGEGRRANCVTYSMTLNGVHLSRDLAMRSVIIYVKRPVYSGTWEDEVSKFITDNRDAIIADIVAFYDREQQQLAKFSRWGAWEAAVLSRLDKPEEVQRLIEDRQRDADVDSDESSALEHYFEEQLLSLTYKPDVDRVFIPSRVASQWFNEAMSERRGQVATTRAIKQQISEGIITKICECKDHGLGRGFIWAPTSEATETCDGIEERIEFRRLERIRVDAQARSEGSRIT